jgi:hypothetical protein
MGIRFACHLCGRPLHIKAELAGKIGRCPACQQRFQIPLQDSETSLPVEPEPHAAPTKTSGTEARTTDTAADAPRSDSTPGATDANRTSPAEPLQWFVHRPSSDEPYGPADESLIQAWVAEHRITHNTLVWRSDWPDWRIAGDVFPGLATTKAAPEPAATRPSGPAAAEPITSPPADPIKQTPQLQGAANIGKQRREKVRQRSVWVIGLGLICVCLLALLGVLLWW